MRFCFIILPYLVALLVLPLETKSSNNSRIPGSFTQGDTVPQTMSLNHAYILNSSLVLDFNQPIDSSRWNTAGRIRISLLERPDSNVLMGWPLSLQMGLSPNQVQLNLKPWDYARLESWKGLGNPVLDLEDNLVYSKFDGTANNLLRGMTIQILRDTNTVNPVNVFDETNPDPKHYGIHRFEIDLKMGNLRMNIPFWEVYTNYQAHLNLTLFNPDNAAAKLAFPLLMAEKIQARDSLLIFKLSGTQVQSIKSFGNSPSQLLSRLVLDSLLFYEGVREPTGDSLFWRFFPNSAQKKHERDPFSNDSLLLNEFNIIDYKGFTSQAKVEVIHRLGGAKLLRMGSDTGSAQWKPFQEKDSIQLSLHEGKKILYAQYGFGSNSFSPWYTASTWLDTTLPSVNPKPSQSYPSNLVQHSIDFSFSLEDKGGAGVIGAYLSLYRVADSAWMHDDWTQEFDETFEYTVPGTDSLKIDLGDAEFMAGEYILFIRAVDRAKNIAPKYAWKFFVSDSNTINSQGATSRLLAVNDSSRITLDSVFTWKEDSPDSLLLWILVTSPQDSLSLESINLARFFGIPSIRKVAPLVYKVKFLVNPLQQDVGSLSSQLIFSIKQNSNSNGSLSTGTLSSLRIPFKATILEVNDAPLALINLSQSGAAIRASLGVLDEDGTLSETQFRYVLYKGSQRKDSASEATKILEFFPLSDGDYELKIWASDRFLLSQPNPSVKQFSVKGITTFTLDSARWVMAISPWKSKASSSLESGITVAHWQDDGIPDKLYNRYVMHEKMDSLRESEGYWYYSEHSFKVITDSVVIPTKPLQLKLTKGDLGWNQIANPFPYAVDVRSEGLKFWSWDSGRNDMVLSKGILMPRQAYWVQVTQARTLNILNKIYYPDSVTLNKTTVLSKAAFYSKNQWSASITLQAGKFSDNDNIFGIRPNHATLKQENGLEAPRMGRYVSLAFRSSEQSAPEAIFYKAIDVNNLDQGVETSDFWWDMQIDNQSFSTNTANITVKGISELQSQGYQLYLVKAGTAQVIEDEVSISVSMNAELNYYSLALSKDPNFSKRVVQGLSLQGNAPNPVSHSTDFLFYLPYQWSENGSRIADCSSVQITIFDVSGRQVDVIHSKNLLPGPQRLTWVPGRSAKRPVPGVYYYRLKTDKQSISGQLWLQGSQTK